MMDFGFYGLKTVFGFPEGTLWSFSSEVCNCFCWLGGLLYTKPLKAAHTRAFPRHRRVLPCTRARTHTHAQADGEADRTSDGSHFGG